jgi:LmbE family N-acetylglucosaminyl deacetylase
MKLHQETAELFIPDGSPLPEALARTTHLAISAHQDDVEIMAAEPIFACFQREDRWFAAVVMGDGRGSPRDDLYRDYNDDQMRWVRFKEQRKAAVVGEYAGLAQLDYPTSTIKDARERSPTDDLLQVLRATHPESVYTHNLADKHDTHVATALRVIEAIRQMEPAERPQRLYGCEVWRSLDWLMDEDKVPFDLSLHDNLQSALLGIYDSQICGGKRYDLATMGRRRANATYFESHGVDTSRGLAFGMDLTPLIDGKATSADDLIQAHIDRFAKDVAERLKRVGGSR